MGTPAVRPNQDGLNTDRDPVVSSPFAVKSTPRPLGFPAFGAGADTDRCFSVTQLDVHQTFDEVIQLVAAVVVQARTATTLPDVAGHHQRALQVGQDLGTEAGESCVDGLVGIEGADVLHVS